MKVTSRRDKSYVLVLYMPMCFTWGQASERHHQPSRPSIVQALCELPRWLLFLTVDLKKTQKGKTEVRELKLHYVYWGGQRFMTPLLVKAIQSSPSCRISSSIEMAYRNISRQCNKNNVWNSGNTNTCIWAVPFTAALHFITQVIIYKYLDKS